MIRLLIVAIVVAAIRAQVASGVQYVPSCACGGGPHPLYNLLPPTYRGKYPALIPKGPPVASVNPPPASCSCGPYQIPAQTLNIAASPGAPQPSGVLVYSPGPLPQTGPTVLQAPSPFGTPLSPPPPDLSAGTDSNASHIMTIPKKYPADSTQTYVFANNPVPDTVYSSNSIFAEPSPRPVTFPSHPLYYTQQASLISSCPATVVYPASTQPVSGLQTPIASYSLASTTSDVSPSPSHTTFINEQPIPVSVYTPQASTLPSVSEKSASVAAAAAAAATSAASASSTGSVPKNPLLTYTLLGATKKKDGFPGSSLEAENNDCGMPGPPPTVLKFT